MKAYHTEDQHLVTETPRLLCSGSERECRQAAAMALGHDSLRGLRTAPSSDGVYYYSGESYVELVY